MDGNATDAALTLPGTLRRTATIASLTHPDAGVVTPVERAPWGRVLTGSEALAARLADLGVPDGGRVALLTGNSVAGVEMLFACGMLGAVCVPVPDGHDAGELRRLLAEAEVDTLVVTDPGRLDLVRDAVPELGGSAEPTALEVDGLPGLRRAVVVGADAAGPARIDDTPGPSAPMRFARPGDVAVVLRTAGTTGGPRGCELTHGAVVAAGRALGDRIGLDPEDVVWSVLPLDRPGFLGPLLAILEAGGTVVTDDGFAAGRAWTQVRAERATVLVTGAPVVTDALRADPRAAWSFESVRTVLDLGTPRALGAVQSVLPRAVVLTGYATTETAGFATLTGRRDADAERLGTHGHPLAGVEVDIVDPDTGGPLPSGEPGRIRVRGATTFLGHLGADRRDPDAWFATGDLGLLDADGRLRHLGRVADRVTVGGEKVAAPEVEAVLAGHPDVVAVAVVAAPDPDFDEVPAAFVQLRPGAEVTAEQLQEHCADALPRFKVPRHVRFVTSWP
ncbi:MAG: class I adenylate-forming enzyme family protein, partial [Pseudonocardia sediminis]